MEIHRNFGERILVRSDELDWAPSPMPGVERRMLDRVGGEVARATSIVRYAPGSHFSAHVHDGGEEFIVLSGVFQDEHGDYPVGSYLRNPPTSRHTPGSAPGCEIFVKLHQFDPKDRSSVRIRPEEVVFSSEPDRAGVRRAPLHSDPRETVSILDADAGAQWRLPTLGGAELLVLEGQVEADGDEMARGAWLRVPGDEPVSLRAGARGVRCWVKQGHLRYAEEEVARLEAALADSD